MNKSLSLRSVMHLGSLANKLPYPMTTVGMTRWPRDDLVTPWRQEINGPASSRSSTKQIIA